MNDELRNLVEKWRADAKASVPENTYGMFIEDVAVNEGVGLGLTKAAEELQAALDAQAGMVMVPKEPVTGPRYEAGDWSRRNWEAALADQLAAAQAGPVEGGKP